MNKKSRGLNLLDLLAILFIGLKLCNVIDWSWGWVLSPIWINLAIILIVTISEVLSEVLNDTKE